MPLVGTRGGASARAYGFTSGSGPEVLGGMVLVTPTSIASTGTGNSSSINTNGSVTFGTCATLSLNGVFTADYDNYIMVMRNVSSASNTNLYARLRASGTDSTATTDYNLQWVIATATSVAGGQNTADGYWFFPPADSTWRNGFIATFYGPFLSQPTAVRASAVQSLSGAVLYDHAGTHELSTSYDGITIYPSTGSFTGLVSVYGLVGA